MHGIVIGLLLAVLTPGIDDAGDLAAQADRALAKKDHAAAAALYVEAVQAGDAALARGDLGTVERGLEGPAIAGERAMVDHGRRNAQGLGTVQPAGSGAVGQDETGPRGVIARHALDELHHVGAAPRDQDGDAFHPSWPR